MIQRWVGKGGEGQKSLMKRNFLEGLQQESILSTDGIKYIDNGTIKTNQKHLLLNIVRREFILLR